MDHVPEPAGVAARLGRRRGPARLGAGALGALALGSAALGGLILGGVIVGGVVVGRLYMRRGQIDALTVGDLVVERLTVVDRVTQTPDRRKA